MKKYPLYNRHPRMPVNCKRTFDCAGLSEAGQTVPPPPSEAVDPPDVAAIGEGYWYATVYDAPDKPTFFFVYALEGEALTNPWVRGDRVIHGHRIA